MKLKKYNYIKSINQFHFFILKNNLIQLGTRKLELNKV